MTEFNWARSANREPPKGYFADDDILDLDALEAAIREDADIIAVKEVPSPRGRTFVCCVCHLVAVDALNGEDTCFECLRLASK